MSQYSYTPDIQPVSSRRAKVEQKKLIRQTIFISVGAIIFVAVSFIFIIPAILRFIGGSAPQTTNEQGNLIPLQAPAISAIATATSSAKITLSGFTNKNVSVVILKNTQEDQTVSADQDGKFSVEVTLESGENTLSAYAKEGTQNSPVSQQFKTLLDTEPPVIEIKEPKDGQSVVGKSNQDISIKGKTESKSRIYINDRLASIQADGTFVIAFHLENGQNELNIKVIDQAGNTTEQKLKLSFAE